jgi:uncharacterized protein (TIGR03435 family)
MFRRSALLAFFAVPLLAQTPAWQEFTLGPARGKLEIGTNNIRQGIFHSNSISLRSLIELATGMPVARVIGPDWIGSDHYAIAATLSEESRLRLRTRSADDPRVIEEFRALLTQELQQRFRLQFHRETRDTLEYTLQPAEGAPVTLHPSAPRERGRINLTNPALSHESTLDAHAITMRTMGNWLEAHLKAPVTLAVAMPEGAYDFQLQWKTNDDASLFAALKIQLGAELVKQTTRQEYLVVDRVERPGVPPAPAPETAPRATPLPDSSVVYTFSELRRDLHVLHDALEEGHPGIYRYTPKAEVDRSFQQVEAQLTHSLTALEFYRLLAPLVAHIKCGHTELRPSAAMRIRLADEPLLPIEAAIGKGKVQVARDFSESRLAGAEILAINDVAAGSILTSMLAAVHGDGDSATAGPYRLSHGLGFARNLYLISGMQSPFRVRYSLDGKTAETVVNGMPLNAMTEPETPRAGNASWRLLEDGSSGLLRVKAFEGKAEGEIPMAAFFDRVFAEIRAKGLSRLILDVRDNGGGEDELGRRLYAYFADQPFLYYRDLILNKLSFHLFQYVPNREPLPANIHDLVKLGKDDKYHLVGHPNWGVQRPAAAHFAGKTVVLMNGGSLSTTCEFLAMLHHRGGAAFVGEETGGGYYGNTSGTDVALVLPRSKLILQLPLVSYTMAIEGNAHGSRGIQPDHPVEYAIEDVIRGRDRAMETALAIAR